MSQIKGKQISAGSVALDRLDTNSSVAGQILTSNGAGAAPTWEDVGGGNPKEIHITLNEIVVGSTPTYIGAVYVDRSGHINSQSMAYIGCLEESDTATLALHASGSPTSLVSVSVTGTLASASFSGSTDIAIGWYDILLYAAGSSQTAVARGLYIHV